MAVTWKVVNLDYTKSLSGKTNVVTNVHWKAEDVKTSGGKSYPAMEKGSVSLDTSDLSSYTAYDDVTEEVAVGWAKDALSSLEVAAAVEAADAVLYDEGDDIPEGKEVGDVKVPAVEAVERVVVDEVTAVEERIAASIDAQENTTTGKGKPWVA
jgi:hypothetical protein